MNFTAQQALKVERSMIQEMLDMIPADDFIGRFGLEARRDELDAELDKLGPEPRRIQVTFTGKPVDGTRSMVAGFGGKAISHFETAVRTIAAGLSDRLSKNGRLPADLGDLRITGTALGSFGFELELPQSPPPPIASAPTLPGFFDDGDSSVVESNAELFDSAIDDAIRVVNAASGTDDNALADIVGDVHDIAIRKLHEFAKFVAKEDAGFRIDAGPKLRADIPAGHVSRIVAALDDNSVNESTRDEIGTVYILPDTGKFELKLARTGKTISGRVAKSARIDRTLIGHLVVATIKEIAVRSSQKSLVLLSIKEAPPTPPTGKLRDA